MKKEKHSKYFLQHIRYLETLIDKLNILFGKHHFPCCNINSMQMFVRQMLLKLSCLSCFYF